MAQTLYTKLEEFLAANNYGCGAGAILGSRGLWRKRPDCTPTAIRETQTFA